MDTSRVLMEREPENHAGTNELTPPPKTPEWVKFMVLTQRPFPSISQLELWEDGVSASRERAAAVSRRYPSNAGRDDGRVQFVVVGGGRRLLRELWHAPASGQLVSGSGLILRRDGDWSLLVFTKREERQHDERVQEHAVRSRRPAVLRCLHAIDARRL